MAYQVKRQQIITEDIELSGKDGTVEKVLHIEFNPEKLARKFNAARNNIIRAQLELKKGNALADKKLEAFGTAVIEMFKVVFGEENTSELTAFFEGNYVEMLEVMMPFITDVAAPAVQASVDGHKIHLANTYKLSREQRRRLGL